MSACTAPPACLHVSVTGGKDETDSKANATKSEAPVLPKMIKKTIQVTRKKTYHVSTGGLGAWVPPRPKPPTPSRVQS